MENTTNPTLVEDDDPTEEQLDQAFKLAQDELPAAAWDSEEFSEEFKKQLNDILNEEAFQGLMDKGLIERVAREDGSLGYSVTPIGEAIADVAEHLMGI